MKTNKAMTRPKLIEYVVMKTWLKSDDGDLPSEDISFYTIESNAIRDLKATIALRTDDDPEWFGIERREWDHDNKSWEVDENYGESGSLKRLYEFKKAEG